jgi:hypothetical protein
MTQHAPLAGFDDVGANYTEDQKHAILNLQELLRNLLNIDHEFASLVKNYNEARADVATLQGKNEAEAASEQAVDLKALEGEFDTIRQAAKMTVGRQGNHFPLLCSDYFHSSPNDTGFRENVISLLAHIESVDIEAFSRYYHNKMIRIVPYVLMIPTYGDMGICWEPFDRHNRATSRGRIMIPMYPKNLYIALLTAVADLRWQVAKEKASFGWMEEGLTGNYYQWYMQHKLKGEVKGYFIQDYLLWMTKEAEGTQKLDKDVRGIFWRYMPFSQATKDKLKPRSFVYQELCQRDANRASSDGF